MYSNDEFPGMEGIASTTECTGLIQNAVADEAEAEAYTDISSIPKPGVDHFVKKKKKKQ